MEYRGPGNTDQGSDRPFARLRRQSDLPGMSPDAPTLFFDYVDPICYLLDSELVPVLAETGAPTVTRVPVELCPPPRPLMDPEGPWWTARWHAAAEIAKSLGIPLVEPAILPWTRKAHELVLHAASQGLGAEAHRAVFQAIFGRGEDIGRVDVLVELARGLGLDPTETKAVLDVDRYTQEVRDLGAQGEAEGVGDPPLLQWTSRSLQGFHNRNTLRTFLLR